MQTIIYFVVSTSACPPHMVYFSARETANSQCQSAPRVAKHIHFSAFRVNFMVTHKRPREQRQPQLQQLLIGHQHVIVYELYDEALDRFVCRSQPGQTEVATRNHYHGQQTEEIQSFVSCFCCCL